MRFIRQLITGSAMVALATTASLAGSHSGANPAVKARQAHMQLNQFNAGTLFGMAKGDVDFDAAAAQAAADNLAALSSLNQMGYWSPGTSNADLEGTRALPAIWEAGSEVMAKVEDLHTAAMAMAENAGTLDGVKANIGAVGAACTACHKAYRAPE